MPVEVHLKGKYILVEYSGMVNVEESIAVFDQISGSEAFDRIRFWIVDCSKVESFSYSESDLLLQAAYTRALSRVRGKEHMKAALIVASKNVEASIIKYMTTTSKIRNDWERRIFYNFDDAYAWASL